jgi:hypothetical protein
VWYFRTVLTVWYFRTVTTVWYFRTVTTVWYFRTVTTAWYFRTVLKYHTVATVLKYHTVRTVPNYHTVITVLKYHTVMTVLPVKKIKYNKILTYILRSIFLEIPHLELPHWGKYFDRLWSQTSHNNSIRDEFIARLIEIRSFPRNYKYSFILHSS